MSEPRTRAEFIAGRAACPSGHDRLEFHRTNRRTPARCLDCGTMLETPELFDLFLLWMANAEKRQNELEARIAALEADAI